MKPLSDILLFSPSSSGGIAEHTLHQARTLRELGMDILVLAPPDFLEGRPASFPLLRKLRSFASEKKPRFLKACHWLATLLYNHAVLTATILQKRPTLVFFDSYNEYFSPLWIWPHWLLGQLLGIRYGANLHDPVRDFQVGPAWWHRLSIRLAYLPMDFVCIHDDLPDPSPVPRSVKAVKVPMGIYALGESRLSREEVRRQWGVGEGQHVFLAFGYLRDNKNLDLAIRALEDVPEAFLVIAGSVPSERARPFSFYQSLAEAEGVAGRCRLIEGFIHDDDLGMYFAGTDFVLLTYASTFVSQSGVLHVAARAHKPFLASSGPGPLAKSVRDFRLGLAVEPDSASAVARGMRALIENPTTPDWTGYETFASWESNARSLLAAAQLEPRAKATHPENLS